MWLVWFAVETKEASASGGVTAALVPVTADDDTEDEDEDENKTNKPNENNKETTKAQEEEANQDATNKEKPQSPKLKGKRHLFCNYI